MSTSKLKVGDKVAFRMDEHALKSGTVTGFSKHKIRVRFSYCGFEHNKLMFDRNLTLL